MTTKTLSTYVAAGYSLMAPYDTLDITTTGGVGGFGVKLNFAATVDNYGRIDATSGGANGVSATAAATITNGSATNSAALIEGYSGIFVPNAAGTVTNLGTIDGVGRYGDGVFIVVGGQVTNGAASAAAALIEGDNSGVSAGGLATVDNFGTIVGANSDGVYIKAGGAVTNGAASDPAASIEGKVFGVGAFASATVVNFGAIVGQTSAGVYLKAGGSVTNGSTKDTSASIQGYGLGVQCSGAGTVSNFGSIRNTAAAGRSAVYMSAGGRVTNGSTGDTTALIEGYYGVEILSAYGRIDNFATITGGIGVLTDDGALVTNGGSRDIVALIEGDVDGVLTFGPTSVDNFGTILGGAASHDSGVYLRGAGAITNGSAKNATALIEGGAGIRLFAGEVATVDNFGTIEGESSAAVQFTSSSDVLIVEAGCAFFGAVLGAGGTLDLASGTGKITGLFAGGDVTVSGSMASTAFQAFGVLEIGAGAAFTSKGAVSVSAGQSVNDAGTLTLGGGGKNSIVNAGLIETTGSGFLTLAGTVDNSGTLLAAGGTLTVSGTVSGPGGAVIDGGRLVLALTFTENIAFSGTAGVLELDQSRSFTRSITGFSQTGGTSLDLRDIQFVAATEATFSGKKSGGVLTVTDGKRTAKIHLTGDYTHSTFVASSDGQGGVDVVAQADPVSAPPHHAFVAAMAGLAGPRGGAIQIGHGAPARETMLAGPRSMIA